MSSSRKIMQACIVAAWAGASSGACWASGFALIEQNSSGLGNAYAGQAAAAEDASTIYFNPAGMTRLQGRSFVFAGHLISPSAKFNNTGTTAAVSTTTGTGAFALNGNGGDAGAPTPVPSAYLSWQLSPQLYAGVGVSVPFGLGTEYDANWMGRFHTIKSEIKSVNVNPSVAYKINDAVSVGAGLSWQRVDAELTKATNYSYIGSLAGLPLAANSEGTNRMVGHDSAWGFNLGMMIRLTPSTDLGLTYRSAIGEKLSGNIAYTGRPAALTAALPLSAAVTNQAGDSGITADLKTPASASVAIKHQLDSAWEMLADVSWTQWSSFKNLIIVRTDGLASGQTLENVPENWRDTWRVGLGANYKVNSAWKLRMGVAFDQSPMNDTYRTPRIVDQDRRWVALGGQYKVSNAGTIDFGYAHLFVKDPALNLNGVPALTASQAAGRGSLVGNYNNQVDILSVQYTHSF